MMRARLAALGSPVFRLFALGSAASLLGTWAQRVVLFWLAWEMTRSTVVLGVLALADLLPALLTSPLGGMLADRDDRVRMAVRVQVLSALPPLLLAVTSCLGMLDLTVVMAATLLGGICTGLDHPLRLTLISNLAPPEHVPSAVSINSMIFNLSRMIGPALGGLAIAGGAVTAVFAMNLVSFVFFALVLRRIKPPPRPESAGGDQAAVGWAGVWPLVPLFQRLALLYLVAVSLFLRPVYEMLPAFADRLAGGDSEAANAFALMSGAVGLGAFFGALSAPGMRSGRALIVSGLAGVVSIAAMVWIDSLWLTLLAIALSSWGILASSIATQILLHLGVPPEVRGRVLALYAMVLRGMPAAGALFAGWLATRIELTMVFVWFGLPVLAVTLWLALELRRRR